MAVFARLAVHLVPILASIFIITLNLCHLYLGRSFPGLVIDNSITVALLQIVAKLQELLICASRAAIIFSVIRSLLVSSTGVPLGMLPSSFLFVQISFFWSMEFWGAVRSKMPLRTKVLRVLLLLVAGLIAATAGPSVAVLLVPRVQDWDAGGSEFYLRETTDDISPTNLSHQPRYRKIVTFNSRLQRSLIRLSDSLNATDNAVCLSGGFTSIKSHAAYIPRLENDVNLRSPPRTIHGAFGSHLVNIESTLPVIPATQLLRCPRGVACQTAVTTSYLPTMIYQAALKSDRDDIVSAMARDSGDAQSWSRAEYNYYFSSALETHSQVPVVRTACSVAQNISTTENNIEFPIMPGYACWKETTAFRIPNINRTPSDSLRFTWTQLSPEFGSTSAGMVFEGTSRVVIGCSIDARWANGKVDALQGYSKDLAFPEKWKLRRGLRTPFRPPIDGAWRPITLDGSWLQLLMPSQGSKNTFQSILDNSNLVDDELTSANDQTTKWNDVIEGLSNRTVYLERVTTLIVADGISRYGADRVLNMSGPVSNWSLLDYSKKPSFKDELFSTKPALQKPNGTKFETFSTSISINGLSYKASSVTDYLAMAVLVAHIALALGHSIHLLYTHKTQMHGIQSQKS
ncbi:hypothetical protein EDB80DRAFT_898282 [Ilyonectria destructans]|nr:hypothetical protein EDB80DRAFT_898282 [Ilyonectria destructans]